MGAFLNSVILSGRINKLHDAHHFRRANGSVWHVRNLVLWTVQKFKHRKDRQVFVDVKMEGRNALRSEDMALREGDWLQLKGVLEQVPRKTKVRGANPYFQYVRVQTWSALWPPPNQFRRGYVQVERMEYERLKSLVETSSEFDLPEGVLEAFVPTNQDIRPGATTGQAATAEYDDEESIEPD